MCKPPIPIWVFFPNLPKIFTRPLLHENACLHVLDGLQGENSTLPGRGTYVSCMIIFSCNQSSFGKPTSVWSGSRGPRFMCCIFDRSFRSICASRTFQYDILFQKKRNSPKISTWPLLHENVCLHVLEMAHKGQTYLWGFEALVVWISAHFWNNQALFDMFFYCLGRLAYCSSFPGKDDIR